MVVSKLALQHSTDNINRVSNTDTADMYMEYGSENGNARMAARSYEERFHNCYLPGHLMFTSLHQRLRDTGCFTANITAAGGPERIRAKNERILQDNRDNSRTSNRAAANILRKRVIPKCDAFSVTKEFPIIRHS